MLSPCNLPTLPLVVPWPHLQTSKLHVPTTRIDETEQWINGPSCQDFVVLTEDLIGRLNYVEVDESPPPQAISA